MRRSRAFAAVLVTIGTFTDLLAYSVAVPVLPDLTARMGVSASTVGFLFASFGVTLLGVSIPIGTLSDRIGRRLPLVAGMSLLALSTLVFAYATSLPWLFAARLLQGAADAITWGVGFALIADLFAVHERGRVMGLVMSGSNLGFMIGPSIGGWLYERAGQHAPFQLVSLLAAIGAVGFVLLRLPPPVAAGETVPFRRLVTVPSVAVCTVIVATASATFAMYEPVLSLFLASSLGESPSRIGLAFGGAALASAVMHPVWGAAADRFGARRVMLVGLVAAPAVMPFLARAETYTEALTLFLVQSVCFGSVVTPSLTFMAEAGARAGAVSFGVSYGLYNFAWGVGLLGGPALGGVLYERIGFARLLLVWPLFVLGTAGALAWVRGSSPARVSSEEHS